jgi:hypothetical protein
MINRRFQPVERGILHNLLPVGQHGDIDPVIANKVKQSSLKKRPNHPRHFFRKRKRRSEERSNPEKQNGSGYIPKPLC